MRGERRELFQMGMNTTMALSEILVVLPYGHGSLLIRGERKKQQLGKVRSEVMQDMRS